MRISTLINTTLHALTKFGDLEVRLIGTEGQVFSIDDSKQVTVLEEESVWIYLDKLNGKAIDDDEHVIILDFGEEDNEKS